MAIQSIKKKLWAFVHEVVYVLSKIIPKDKNTWVFGSWQGNLFSDNSKYLFIHITENYPEINAAWITKDKDVLNDMRKQGYKCYYHNSLSGIRVSLKASVAFTTTGLGDVAEWASAGIKHISLWHGTPLKKIGYDNTEWGKVLKYSTIQKIKLWFLPYVNRDASEDIYIVSSDQVKKTFISAFRTIPEHVYVVGQPRNDVFIRPYSNSYFEELKANNPDKKIICYMPTHRNFGTVNNNPLNADVLLSTDEFLRENNIILILKPHFHEMKNYLHLAEKFSNIILGIDKEIFADPYSFLPYCDLLISDYSSVYVDFICSGKPIILFPYDLENYLASDASLYYAYEDVAPGAICFTWDDVLTECVKELRTNDISEKYRNIQEIFNKYNDGHNCERTYKVVKDMLAHS